MHRLWLPVTTIPRGIDLLLRREGTRNGWQPTADALLTIQARRQLVATRRNGFGLFEPFLGLECPRLGGHLSAWSAQSDRAGRMRRHAKGIELS